MFFDDWAGLVPVGVIGTCGYLSLVLPLRVPGKRTVAKLNAFDFIVTVGRIVKSAPTLPYRDGLLNAPMRGMRVTQDEILKAARTAGHARLESVAPVALETGDSMSILTEMPTGRDLAIADDLGGPGR